MKVILALFGVAASIKVNRLPSDQLPPKNTIFPPQLQWNEDYHSVPTPLEGKPYLTSTQARFISENSTANQESREPKGAQWWHYNYGPYNEFDNEYGEDEHRWSPLNGHLERYSLPAVAVEEPDEAEKESSLIQLDSEAMTLTNAQTGALWRVIPDFGEKDPNVMYREEDIKNGAKFGGWNNPLAWTDDGTDDNLVV